MVYAIRVVPESGEPFVLDSLPLWSDLRDSFQNLPIAFEIFVAMNIDLLENVGWKQRIFVRFRKQVS